MEKSARSVLSAPVCVTAPGRSICQRAYEQGGSYRASALGSVAVGTLSIALRFGGWDFPSPRRRGRNIRGCPGCIGGRVPDAKVVISSAGQGTLRTLTTNAEGIFCRAGAAAWTGL